MTTEQDSNTDFYRQIFKIDRSKWLHGNHQNASKMCNEHGEKCCLGFITQQATNCTNEDMRNCYGPGDVQRHTKIKFDPLLRLHDNGCYGISKLADLAMEVNDKKYKNPTHREVDLIQLFKDYGIHIEFHGEYPNG